MAVLKIENCIEVDYNKIVRSITQYNYSYVPSSKRIPARNIRLAAKSDRILAGGITGSLLLGDCLSIEVLWVYEQFRLQGIAKRLLFNLENIARENGSHLAYVDTFDFQALGFYEKQGYEQFGVLNDCPLPGNKRYYLKKPL